MAQALGLVAVAGFIDCRKCYDHVILRALSRSAYRAGLGWLGERAVDQYSSERRVRWAVSGWCKEVGTATRERREWGAGRGRAGGEQAVARVH